MLAFGVLVEYRQYAASTRPPLAWPEFMFFKKRTADSQTSRTPRPERPRVRATWNGVLYVDQQEPFESEVGQRALREAEELERRLRGKPSIGDVAPTASDRPHTGD